MVFFEVIDIYCKVQVKEESLGKGVCIESMSVVIVRDTFEREEQMKKSIH